jgi:hypothetical protein
MQGTNARAGLENPRTATRATQLRSTLGACAPQAQAKASSPHQLPFHLNTLGHMDPLSHVRDARKSRSLFLSGAWLSGYLIEICEVGLDTASAGKAWTGHVR